MLWTGAGSIFEALRAGRRLLVVVNASLMDNHQVELAEAMQRAGRCRWTMPEDLVDALRRLPRVMEPLPPADPAVAHVARVLLEEVFGSPDSYPLPPTR